MDDKKIQTLAKLFEISNNGLTHDEFLAAFKSILEQFLKLKENLLRQIDYKFQEEQQSLNQLRQGINQFNSEARSEARKELEKNFIILTSEIKSTITQELKKIDTKLIEVDQRVALISNGLPELSGGPDESGKDVDEKQIIQDVLGKLNLPNYESEIKYLQEEIDELKRQRRFGRLGGGGGGFSKIAMDSHLIDDETPSGTVNGITTNFTLASTPNPPASVKVFVNGARMRITEDYTLSGRTITFLTAPPTNSIILCDYRT